MATRKTPGKTRKQDAANRCATATIDRRRIVERLRAKVPTTKLVPRRFC